MADSLRTRSPRRSPRTKVADRSWGLKDGKERKSNKSDIVTIEDKENMNISNPIPTGTSKPSSYQIGTDPKTVRANLLQENVTSEEGFVTALAQMTMLFFEPLQKIDRRHEIGLVIKALKAITEVSNEYFSKTSYLLKACIEVPLDQLGTLFVHLASQLPAFKQYVCNYTALTSDFLPALVESKSAIRNLIEENNSAALVAGSQVTFSDMLIMPVQRVTRYVMLAESLLKTCQSNPPIELVEGYNKLKAVADEINDEIRAYDQQLATLKSKVESFPCLQKIPFIVAPFRHHVKDFYINMPIPNTNRLERAVLFLFNNLLVLARIDEKNGVTAFEHLELAVTFFGQDSLNLKSTTRRQIVTEQESWTIDFGTVSAAKDFDTVTWNEIEQLTKKDAYYAAKRERLVLRYDSSTNTYDLYQRAPMFAERISEKEFDSQKTKFTGEQVMALQNAAASQLSNSSSSKSSAKKSKDDEKEKEKESKEETPLTPRRGAGTPKKERGGILGFISPIRGGGAK